MIDRRRALGALLAAGAAACGGAAGRPTTPRAPALHLDPLSDLVAAAGLVWLLVMRPREVLATAPLASVVGAAVPAETFDALSRHFGAVDLRQADALVIAGFPGATLGLARVPVAPGLVEAAFRRRAAQVEGRAVEGGVVRVWGSVGHEERQEREEVALFGTEAAGLARGGSGPLEAAAYFAQGRLRRSLPALRAEPLAAAAARLGESAAAPVLAFAPGPFEDAGTPGPMSGVGVGGLLKAATAVAGSLQATDQPRAGSLGLRVVLTGAWGAEAAAAAERLEASFRLLGTDPLGRLTGLDKPLQGPVARGDAESLVLDVALDPVRMYEGVRAIAGAPLAEIMAF